MRRWVVRLAAVTVLLLAGEAAAQGLSVAPPRPSDPVPGAAHDILSKHCNLCHGAGSTQGGVGDITDLDKLAAALNLDDDPLIVAGSPRRSPLYREVYLGRMPQGYGCDRGPSASCPTDEELKALEDWIRWLADPTAVTAPASTDVASAGGAAGNSPIVNPPPPELAPVAVVTATPIAPTDDVAAAAVGVLDNYCTACHGANLRAPAGSFGFVTDLDALASGAVAAKNRPLIHPGNAEDSFLYQRTLNGEMPPLPGCSETPRAAVCPSEEEIAQLKAWIDQLDAVSAPVTLVAEDEIVALIVDDLRDMPPAQALDTRYLTLASLYNAGIAGERLEAYRHATVKLLNSLSRLPEIITRHAIDPNEVVLRVRLSELGWSAEDWEYLVSVYLYGLASEEPEFALLYDLTGSSLPFLRADWLAFYGTRDPIYSFLLKLPPTFHELQAQLGVDVSGNIARGAARRAGVAISGVSDSNRLVERHSGTATRMFWTSYDFASDSDRQNLFEFPTGPGGSSGFLPDGGETIFALPNGFQGYYLNNAAGAQLSVGPTEIVQDNSRSDHVVVNGISCMSCHVSGMQRVTDEIRTFALGNLQLARAQRDEVEALFPTVPEMAQVLDADTEAFIAALAAAGIPREFTVDPGRTVTRGAELIYFLSLAYEAPLTLVTTAAEYGLSPEILRERSALVGGDIARLLRRLDQGNLIQRDDFEALFQELAPLLRDVEAVGGQRVADLVLLVPPGQTQGRGGTTGPVVTTPAGSAGAAQLVNVAAPRSSNLFDLSLYSDKSAYAVGDYPVFTVRSSQACHLTLINIDQQQKATVLFPNQYERNNLIPAHTDFLVPGPSVPFQIQVTDANRGEESVLAICDTLNQDVLQVTDQLGASLVAELDSVLSRSLAVVPVGNLNKTQVRTAIRFEVR